MLKTAKGDYALKYTYNAMCEYEERFHRSLLPDVTKAGFAVLRGLIWAGLIHLNPAHPMSEKEVGELLESAIECGMDVLDIRKEVTSAIENATFMQRLMEKTDERLTSSRKRKENA